MVATINRTNSVTTFFDQFLSPYSDNFLVVIEDDGKVAYAYLLKEKEIIGDVWLYNQQETPEVTSWKNKEDLPFINPKEFIGNCKMVKPVQSPKEITITWKYESDLKEAKIYINNELVAILIPEMCPSFSTRVCKDGPLARKL